MSDAPAIENPAQTADFTFKVAELTTEVLRVTAFSGTEGVSELFRFEVELCSDDPNIDFTTIVGKQCLLEFTAEAGSRYVNAIVKRFEHTGEGVYHTDTAGAKLTYYAAEIVPVHWQLSRRIKSRLFIEANCSDMTVKGIIKKVLEDAGLAENTHFKFALQESYTPAREFVVQYRESDMDFISRMMEQEGIFYFFEHTADGHKMVIGDSKVAHTATPNLAEYPYRDPNGLVPEEEHEYAFSARDREEMQIGSVVLDDYNFQSPSMELRSTAKADIFTALELSDFPGEYIDSGTGTRWAKMRLEEQQCQRRVVHLSAVIRGLMPGYKFSMIEHPRAALNAEFMVTHLSHRGTQSQSTQEQDSGTGTRYEVDIRAIPAATEFRPPRKTPRPVIVGSQTALVVGASGEEIYTDDEGYGRVKIQFHWDRESQYNENSSFWVRVSQGWAGGNYGMICLPRVGQEVIVDFLEGNPDRPIITGRVYNNDNMPPYALPGEKTKSTWKSRSSKGGGGFNEIRFEDKKDSEQIFMHGQKDLDIRIKETEKDFIGKDKHEIIKGMQAKSIGGNEGRSVGGDCGIDVKGKYGLNTGGTALISTGGNFDLVSEADITMIGVKAALCGDSFAKVKSSDVYILGSSSITLKSGGSFIKIDGSGVTIFGGQVKINSGGGPGPEQTTGEAAEVAPAGPAEAATGDPGKDFTYSQEALAYDPLESAPTHDENAADPTESHWIGVRLFDSNGQPLAGERYYIKMPDGTKVAKGETNKDGEVEVKGIDPGSCTVIFPDLDGATWDAGPPPPEEGGAAGAPVAGGAPSVPGGGSAPSVPGLG
ncbi:Phage-related baseplate assembly protein [Phycisphaerae bacterium RAS1]|nr:Phage-related baseplate assembly protein [Phycisphaerae bacterium RAS1]